MYGLIILESICCKIIVTISITNACSSPPVNKVITEAMAIAIIAPK